MRGTLGDLVASLAGESWPPVVVVAGADQDGRERAMRVLVNAVPEEDRAASVQRVPAAPFARALDAARTAPLFGARRVVIATGCDWLVAGGDETAQRELTRYLENAPANSVLVLAATRVDRRLAPVKAVEERGFLLECSPPQERDMPHWIAERGRDNGLVLSAEAAQLLADAVGTDTGLASRELEKLALLVERPGRGPQTPVSSELLESSLGPTRVAGAFALEDALLAGRTVDALEALDRQMAGADAGTPLALLGRCAAILRRLSLAAGVVARGGGEQDVQRTLGGHPFVAQKYTHAARRLGRRAENALAACVVADGMLKSGRDPRAALEGVILALTGPGEA